MSERSHGARMSTKRSHGARMSTGLVIILATSLPFSACFTFPKEEASPSLETANKIPEEVEAQTQLVVLRNSKKLKG